MVTRGVFAWAQFYRKAVRMAPQRMFKTKETLSYQSQGICQDGTRTVPDQYNRASSPVRPDKDRSKSKQPKRANKTSRAPVIWAGYTNVSQGVLTQSPHVRCAYKSTENALTLLRRQNGTLFNRRGVVLRTTLQDGKRRKAA